LDINEVNLVIKALGHLPYNQVSELVTKIHTQAQEQLAAANGQKTVVEEHKL
jgi:hypothetical protein